MVNDEAVRSARDRTRVFVRYVKSTDPGTHAHPIAVWISA